MCALVHSSNHSVLLKQLCWFTPKNTFLHSSNSHSLCLFQCVRWFTLTAATAAVHSTTCFYMPQQLHWVTRVSSLVQSGNCDDRLLRLRWFYSADCVVSLHCVRWFTLATALIHSSISLMLLQQLLMCTLASALVHASEFVGSVLRLRLFVPSTCFGVHSTTSFGLQFAPATPFVRSSVWAGLM